MVKLQGWLELVGMEVVLEFTVRKLKQKMKKG